MSRRYTTPRALRFDLEYALKRAGFTHPTTTKVRYRTIDDGRECLETSLFEYATTRMPLETLEGYERVLRELPGVVATRIVHEDPRPLGLRDQVYVTHLRKWNEPDEEADRG